MPTDSRDPSRRSKSARDVEGDDFWGDARTWNGPTTQVPVTGDAPPSEPAGGGRLGRWLGSIAGSSTSGRRTHGHTRVQGEPITEVSSSDPTPAVGIDPYLDPTVDPASIRGHRTHRAPKSAGSSRAPAGESSMSFAADEDVHDDWDIDGWQDGESWDVEPAALHRSRIDPLIGRIGAIALIVTIAVPVVMGFATKSDATEQLRDVAAEMVTDESVTPTELTTTTLANEQTSVATVAESGSAGPAASPSTAAVPSTSSSAEVVTSATSDRESATVAAAPEPAVTQPAVTQSATTQPAETARLASQPACGSKYELAAGDYWIRIADASDVRLADLLSANNATVDTNLVPGRTICLPAGAKTPAPPPAPTQPPATTQPSTTQPSTTQPSTTQPSTTQPSTTQPSTTQPSTTQPPTTTAPPTTSPPATSPPTTAPPASSGDVESIIRSVWPAHLQEKALAIAWRESNYVPTAKNYCCYGLFQIYWEVHDVWLADHGITSANQLFDPATNARAAYLLYQRAGGFGPWGG